jgi:hypothetical protein
MVPMLIQRHHFVSDEEIQQFERVFFDFLNLIMEDKSCGEECVFMRHSKEPQRQTIVVQATSATVLEAFNSHIEAHLYAKPALESVG